ncbi:MAG: DUF362 domain-containing protein [Thermodesulfobacteriota bacterium]
MGKNTLSRRDFLKYQLAGAVGAALAPGLILPKDLSAQAVPDLAVVEGGPGPATRATVDLLGGIRQFVKPGQKVVIKPNMSFSTPPERASNTHPEVVRELVILCKEAGASSVLVLDHTLHRAESCLENSGIRAAGNAVIKNCVQAVSDPDLFSEVKIPKGKKLASTDIMKAVLNSDVLIAVPVAKSHSSTGVSLSMKGMMGLVHDRGTFHFRDIHTCVVDLCTVLKANLTVIDATRVLTSGGPGGPGKVLKGNMVIASRDMVAADAFTVSNFEWYDQKFKPPQVAHIRQAHERGLGRMDIENLKIKKITV